MSPYYPPGGGGGGSGTPGGTDSQVQVNSQNAFAGFPNLRWIGSSNELNLNSAGRIRKGGVAEVDGVAPAGVTGLIWLDTSASSFTSSSAGLAGTGGYFVVGSAQPLLPGSRILTAGSSVTITTDTTAIYITALTNAGGGTSTTKGWESYQLGPNTGMFLVSNRKLIVANLVNAISLAAGNIMSVNSAYCYPLLVMRSMQIDSMSCIVNVGGSASLIQLGIYTNSADNIPWPFQVVATSGYLSGSDSSTIRAFATTQTLTANSLYWLVYVSQGGTSNIISIPVANSFPIFGSTQATNYGPSPNIQIAMTGTLPAIMVGSGFASGLAGPALAVHLIG